MWKCDGLELCPVGKEKPTLSRLSCQRRAHDWNPRSHNSFESKTSSIHLTFASFPREKKRKWISQQPNIQRGKNKKKKVKKRAEKSLLYWKVLVGAKLSLLEWATELKSSVLRDMETENEDDIWVAVKGFPDNGERRNWSENKGRRIFFF